MRLVFSPDGSYSRIRPPLVCVFGDHASYGGRFDLVLHTVQYEYEYSIQRSHGELSSCKVSPNDLLYLVFEAS